MILTTGGITDNIIMSVSAPGINNKPIEKKQRSTFSSLFYVKQKTSFCQLGAANMKKKSIRKGN